MLGLEHIVSGTGTIHSDRLTAGTAGDNVAFDPGDVLFSKLRPYLAKSLLVKEPLFGTSELMAMRPGSRLDSRFLWYWTLSRPWLDWSNATAYGAKMPRTSWDHMAEFRLRLPPVEEQRRIADFLDAEVALLDRAIALRQTQVRLLLERRAARVLRVVTGADEGPSSSGRLPWAGPVARDWPITKLTHVARLGSGHTPSRDQPDWWGDCTIPWITTGEVPQIREDRLETILETRESLSWLGLANSSAELHPAGTVVLSRTASAGFSAVMGMSMATSQDYFTWTCGPRLLPYFLLWCLRAMRQDLLGRLAMGSTHKTIYVSDIQTIQVPVPDLSAQDNAVATIRRHNSVIDGAVDLMKRQISLLHERKQAFITAAVTGEFDVSAARSVG